RVLAATNRSPQEAVERKLLREDLYYRLNVFQIELPPLRHRMEDVPPIAEAMIRAINEKGNYRVTDLHPEVLGRRIDHSWPGNVRELRNVLERAVIMAGEGTILPEHLPLSFRVPEMRQAVSMPRVRDESALTIGGGRPLHEVEEAYIRLTL